MFKRPRLRPTHHIVNASLAAMVIFLAACSADKTETTENPPENNAPVTPIENANTVELQAVWATNPLTDSITSLAFVGGPQPILAASLADGGLQLFDLQGDRITAPVDLSVKRIASGQAVVLGGVALTLFPGINLNDDLSFYAYARALGDPVELDFLQGIDAAGLCAGPPLDDTAVMQLAYWTKATPTELVHGHVAQDESEELSWHPIATIKSEAGPITACLADAELQLATADQADKALSLAALEKYGERFVFAQTQNGGLNMTDQRGQTRPAKVLDGITVRTPNPPRAMAVLSDVQFGNYPNGLLVLGGSVKGEIQITLIEPGNLFRNAR